MFIFNCYSYLKASIGFSFDADLAGAIPEIIPIIVDKRIAIIISLGVTNVENVCGPWFIPALKMLIIEDAIVPNIAPIMPPTKPNNADSNKNINKISFLVVPSAFIIPISFVFSKTEVNILFATPIAPTIKEIIAIAPRNKVNV